MVSFEKLAQAFLTFIESEIIPHMTAGQEIIARVVMAWILDSGSVAVDYISQNSWAKAFQVVDGKKNINADRALKYLYTIAQKKKRLEFNMPIFGHFAFGPEDIEKLQDLLKEA